MGKKQKRGAGGFRRVGTIATATLTPFIRRAWDSADVPALTVELPEALPAPTGEGIASTGTIVTIPTQPEPPLPSLSGFAGADEADDTSERPAKKQRTKKADDFDVTGIIPHYKRAQDVPPHLRKCATPS